jgi:MFS family permease
MAALVSAEFVVSIGYGAALPALPYLIERLLGLAAQASQVSRHTGLLIAAYTLSPFLFSPVWGRLSDRHCDPSAHIHRVQVLNAFSPTASTSSVPA